MNRMKYATGTAFIELNTGKVIAIKSETQTQTKWLFDNYRRLYENATGITVCKSEDWQYEQLNERSK